MELKVPNPVLFDAGFVLLILMGITFVIGSVFKKSRHITTARTTGIATPVFLTWGMLSLFVAAYVFPLIAYPMPFTRLLGTGIVIVWVIMPFAFTASYNQRHSV